MHLLQALAYLRGTSLVNMLRGRLRRLRQPKYLFGAIAGAFYFWFFFLRHLGNSPATAGLSSMLGDNRGELVGAAVLGLFVFLIWMLPGTQPGLAFSEAEVAFLFPAPLARRQLIHYKLLDGLITSLFGAIFFTLLSNGFRSGWSGGLRHFGGWWTLNANLALHQTAVALTIARLARCGIGHLGRRLILVGLLVAGLAAVGAMAVYSDPAKLSWLLWPTRLVVRPFFAADGASYALALAPALALLGLHYFWVLTMEAPFEDASIARAQRTGEVLARMRAGRGLRLAAAPTKARRAPFALGDRLPPECALLWKNLMLAPPYLNRWVWLGAAVFFAGLTAWLKSFPPADLPNPANFVGGISLALLVYLLIFGPQLARNDLRGDLLNVDLLKTYPLAGWRIVLGQLLAPTVILTSIAWLLLLAAGLGLAPSQEKFPWFTPGFRVAATLALGAVMPLLCAVQLLVPNAATLTFPAWAQASRNVGAGMEVQGQRLIFFAGQLFCLILALLPVVLASGLTIAITPWLIGLPAAVLLAALPAILILAGELWLGVWWLGPKLERLDISAELRG